MMGIMSNRKLVKQLAFRWAITKLMELSGYQMGKLSVIFDGTTYKFNGEMTDDPIFALKDIDKSQAM